MLSIPKQVKVKVFLPYFTFIIKRCYLEFKLVVRIIFEKLVVQFFKSFQNFKAIILVINLIFFSSQLLKFYSPCYFLWVIIFIFPHYFNNFNQIIVE